MLLAPFGTAEIIDDSLYLTPSVPSLAAFTGRPIKEIHAEAAGAGMSHHFYSTEDELGYVSGHSETVSRPSTLKGAIFALGEFLAEYAGLSESIFFEGETVTEADMRKETIIPAAVAFSKTKKKNGRPFGVAGVSNLAFYLADDDEKMIKRISQGLYLFRRDCKAFKSAREDTKFQMQMTESARLRKLSTRKKAKGVRAWPEEVVETPEDEQDVKNFDLRRKNWKGLPEYSAEVIVQETIAMDPVIVNRIVTERKAGKTLQQIADGFMKDEIPQTTGNKIWYASTVGRIIDRI